jgi:hypothetical protein
MNVTLELSTFGLWDVVVDGEVLHHEIPLIMAQALAYCIEHNLDPGWEISKQLSA